MCGRFYVDDETAREIEKIVGKTDETLKGLLPGDIRPSDRACVLSADSHSGETKIQWQRWGFKGSQGRGLFINARCETAMDKKTFREGILSSRIVVPAAGFYEWNREKEKNTFRRAGEPVLFMAGLSQYCDEENRFVILTTKANASMEPVHDRMPLILEPETIKEWLFNRWKTKEILKREPVALHRSFEYEQQTLFL